MNNSVLPCALEYHARGWSVIPTAPRSKIAAGKWKKFQERAADESQIRKWWANGHTYGIAVIFGDVSGGVVCRDFDVQASYDRWAAAHPDLAATLPTVATSRGRHVYFRSDHRGISKFDDGELRGAGYCLLPPSRHPDGPTYRWVVPLPAGPLPFIADACAAGFLAAPCYTEHTENTSNVCSVSTVCSVYQVDDDRLDSMIRQCLPTGPGRRNRQVFELARGIKGIPELTRAAMDDLRPIVQRWHTLALPYIQTKEFTETWIDFLRAWPGVKKPKGITMANIMDKAMRAMPKAARRYEEEPIRRLVALCRQLGREANGGAFFLSCRTAAGLLGVSHVQANRWLFLLAHDGVIEQINKGDRGRRKAAEYRYAGDK